MKLSPLLVDSVILAQERDMIRAESDAAWIAKLLVHTAPKADAYSSGADIGTTSGTGLSQDDQEKLVHDSLSMHVQSMYTGLESVLKNILNEIDGFTPQGDAWHRAILDQAGSPGVMRPALFSDKTYNALNDLRAFRHFIRNSYGVALDGKRVRSVAHMAGVAMLGFRQDLKDFRACVLTHQEDALGQAGSASTPNNGRLKR